MSDSKLSAPVRPSRPPRPLTDTEWACLLRIADQLIPARGADPRASDVPDYRNHLNTALAARADAFDALAEVLADLQEQHDERLLESLRVLSQDGSSLFHTLSSVVAGAYLLAPSVRAAIGYPGQHRDPPRVDEAAEELGDGILDPVIERGSVFTVTPG